MQEKKQDLKNKTKGKGQSLTFSILFTSVELTQILVHFSNPIFLGFKAFCALIQKEVNLLQFFSCIVGDVEL